MTETSDAALLEQFVRHESEAAFAEIANRHIALVHSVALRHTSNPAQAQDITQAVFIILARKAAGLGRKTVLAGWLYHTARLTAANWQRSETRRIRREQEAFMQSTFNESAPDNALWRELSPMLDDAMGRLGKTDRDALVLRYFQNRNLADVGVALGIEERTAQKRVSRALEKLRKIFTRRGVALSATAIAGAVSANAVTAAPVALAEAVAAGALSGTTITTAAVIAATKTIAMTTLQKTLITVTLAATVGVGIYEAKEVARARADTQTLRQQQAPLAERIQQLQNERDAMSNRLASLSEELAEKKANNLELLKLRSQSGQTQTALQELVKLQRSAAEQSGSMPAYLTNATTQGITMSEKHKKKAALAKLERMKDKLHLTDDQSHAISDIMGKNIEIASQQVLNAMLGKQTPVEDQSVNEEAAIKALLTTDQLANYPDFKQAENIATANNIVQVDLTMLTGETDLSQEQQDKARAALYQLASNQASAPQNQEAIAKARASGDFTDFARLLMETQKQTLEDKLKALDGILTPEQLKTYEQKQLDLIEMQASATKMFLPKTTNGVAQ